MRFFLATLSILVLSAQPVQACIPQLPSPSDDEPFDIQQFMNATMDSLERQYEISFPADHRPKIQVGFPEYVPTELQAHLVGIYLPDSLVIAIHPAVVAQRHRQIILPRFTSGMRILTEYISHELGHAYADVGRRITGRMWPVIDPTTSIDIVAGSTIQMEGLAKTFQLGPPEFTFQPDWWSEQVDSTKLQPGFDEMEELSFDGGYQLVGTLVARYGMGPTVAYIVTHPLVIDPTHLRQSVTAWYRQAERDLQ